MFVIVGNMLDSADDSLWEIVGDTVKFGTVFIQQYGANEDLKVIYGEELSSKILNAYEEGSLKEITGENKEKLLKAIDNYVLENYNVDIQFAKKSGILIVYEVKLN